MIQFKEIRVDNEISHVALSGRLDISGIQDIEMKFTSVVANRGKAAIIDLSGVTFLASLGMRMLLSAAKQLKRENAPIILLSPTTLVKEVLEIAGFDSILPIEYDLETAIAKVKSES